MVDGMFPSGSCWFRALSISALKSTLAFFIPHTSGSNSDNEFGPGFYTTESLLYSLRYLRGGLGATMVFKDQYFHELLIKLRKGASTQRKGWFTTEREPRRKRGKSKLGKRASPLGSSQGQLTGCAAASVWHPSHPEWEF